MDVSIIIVNYNTKDCTAQCIESIIKHTNEVSYEVIVVDNNSVDGSQEYIKAKFSEVILIENKENYGFGKANNIGAKVAKGKYLFLLNSDCIILENTIKVFFEYMESNISIASIGGNLIDSNCNLCPSHGKFPTIFSEFMNIGFYLIFKRYYLHNLAVGQTIEEGCINDIDYISGADIFIRKSIYDYFNGFDEKYFLYYEETDLYYRMKKYGFVSKLLSSQNIIHIGGQSLIKAENNLIKFKLYNTSKMLYFRNNCKYSLLWIKLFNIMYFLLRMCKYKINTFKYISIIYNS